MVKPCLNDEVEGLDRDSLTPNLPNPINYFRTIPSNKTRTETDPHFIYFYLFLLLLRLTHSLTSYLLHTTYLPNLPTGRIHDWRQIVGRVYVSL